VQEAEAGLFGPRQGVPIPPGSLEHPKRAHHVRLDEGGRPVDRAVDVRLGSKVDHRPNAVLLQQTADQRAVAAYRD